MTTVAIAPVPFIQVIEGGIEVSGALIFTYAAGTTTKLATYTDATGATPNTNPIVCDSEGKASIYLAAGVLYDFVVSPANDTDPPTNPYDTYRSLYCNAVSPIPYADAGGTSDVVTGTYSVTTPVLIDGYFLLLDIATPNTTTTPTFAPTLNGILQPARTIEKQVGNVNVALSVGDLQGKAMLVYDLGNLVWILQNPAGVSTLENTAAPKLPTVTATVNSNTLTVGASAQYMDFRSATLTSGAITTVNAAPANLVVPTTATLGTANGAQATLYVLELLNAGVAELAICNSSGVNLDETALISTTAISAGATSASTIYSTTQRTSVPFRVIGKLIVTEATAGTWATAPSTIAVLSYSTLSINAATATNVITPSRGFIAGLQMSAAGSSATITIGAGQAADSTNAVFLNLASSYTKTTSAWAVGSGNGGLDTGSIAATTWYYFYLIRRPDTGVVDIVFSTNASTPSLPTNYTQYRYIGMMLTDGSKNWYQFKQTGREFWLATPFTSLSNNSSSTTATLGVFIGVNGRKNKLFLNAGAQFIYYISDPDTADLAPSTTTSPGNSAATGGGNQLAVWTDTSSQIRFRCGTGSGAQLIVTLGWMDLADSQI